MRDTTFSVVNVLTPFIKFYNLFGLYVFDITSESFKILFFSCFITIINLFCGMNYIYVYFFREIIRYGRSKLFNVGIMIILALAISSSVLMLLLNIVTTYKLKKLIQAFIRYDAHVRKISNLNFRHQFIILSTFWILTCSCLLLRCSMTLASGYHNFLLNFYITVNFYLGSELAIMMLFLAAYRFRNIRISLDAFILKNESKSKIQFFSVLVNQSFEIVEIISECFGCQMIIVFLSTLLIGMFTVYAGFILAFNTATESANAVFNTYIYYTIFLHLSFIIVCFLNEKISQEVQNQL